MAIVAYGTQTRSMDVTFSNVLEGTRQYFLGLPKQAKTAEGSGASPWHSEAMDHGDNPTSVSTSTASTPTAATQPPRPPSEPLEPEPHIIHKATVMREAAEKRREQPDPEDEDEATGALSPPSHIIHKPAPPPSGVGRTPHSPAAAPAAPSPSPARPPSAAPPPPDSREARESPQPRPPSLRLQSPASRPPDNFAQARPPDPYSVSRPPETYSRYHYESNLVDTGRLSLGPPVPSPQPSVPPRQSPQTYARLSNSMPQHASRLREMAVHSPPAQRFAMPTPQQLPQHNDRVPPIHHPTGQLIPPQRPLPIVDSRAGPYPTMPQHREPSPYSRMPSHYDRHPQLPQRKYDPQQTYPGYRPSPPAPGPQPAQSHRLETHHQVQYKLTHADNANSHYPTRPVERGIVQPSQSYSNEIIRHQQHELARRPEYPQVNRTIDSRNSYNYSASASSTTTSRYPPSASSTVPVVPSSSLPSRTIQRSAAAPKSSYEYQTSTNHVQTSPARSATKPGYPSQQARMTVSVTTLVNQMNQTKQKRESPLDLSVKTVKNSADSSTTQDDAVDSATPETKPIPLQPRPTSTTRHVPVPVNYVESHKVDFAPDFSRYRERTTSSNSQQVVSTYPTLPQPPQHPVRYNGAYESSSRPPPESYPIDSRHQIQNDRNKYTVNSTRPEYVPRIDLTRSVPDERRQDTRIRDDRHYVIEERKRPAGPIVNNIPEKMVRYETWTADSRIADRMSQSAREQHELMSRPVYSYSSHKQFEAYQNEQKRMASTSVYRDHHHPHTNHRYPGYPADGPPTRERIEYYSHHHERSSSINNRHVIQKIPSHRDVHTHPLDPHSSVPADKRVLSILRNSLETRQTGFVEPAKPARQIPDLIVIDDVDDSVIEITDLTKDNEVDVNAKVIHKMHNAHPAQSFGHHIQMPKAVDSIPREPEYLKYDKDPKSKSPENDVASRIRTKAELKVLPPSQEMKSEVKPNPQNEKIKLLPKSQKQHIFNQIREDSTLDSVIKSEKTTEKVTEVKTEPMNIDEIEKDAQINIKTENDFQDFDTTSECNMSAIDLDWATACDSFMDQLKSGVHKKKSHKKKTDQDNEKSEISKSESIEDEKDTENKITSQDNSLVESTPVVIKQEPIDDDEVEQNKQKNEESLENEIKQLNSSIKNYSISKTSNQDYESDDEKFIKPVVLKNMETKPEQSPNKKIKSTLEKDKLKSQKSLTHESVETRKIKKSRNTDIREDKEKAVKRVKKSLFKKDSDKEQTKPKKSTVQEMKVKGTIKANKLAQNDKVSEKSSNDKSPNKIKIKQEKLDSSSSTTSTNETLQKVPLKTVIKEEMESTDDDEPLIKSKLQKEKEIKYQVLKDLSEKSAYVKLECFDVDMNKNSRISIDSLNKDKDEKPNKVGKMTRQSSRAKGKLSLENKKNETETTDSTSDSDDDDVTVASRLRLRKNIKTEYKTNTSVYKTSVKASPSKKQDNSNSIISSTPLTVRKPGFGDGSDFHPGWEEELYRYKRSLRMPTRLIAIPRGRSGGPFVRGNGGLFARGSTSLPDLDPAPLSPAPSSAPSAATDADIYTRRTDKLVLDSDLDSNSSCSAAQRLHYDSEASTSTVFSLSTKKKTSSIVDVLIQKCGKKDDSKKKNKDRDDKLPKVIPKNTNANELLPTPSLGLVKNGNKGLSAKKEKLMEDIFYLGAFRKATVSAFRNAFINNTDGLIGATEEFAPVVLKTRTRTESRVLKQRATIKEVFGDERPASAPPACREDDDEDQDPDNIPVIKIKKEPKEQESKLKHKPKKILKDKLLRRSSSIRDGLRSTMSLKRNDAKGRLMRLKKRNSLMKSLANKRMKDITGNKIRREKSESSPENKEKPKEPDTEEITEGNSKRRLKRLFGRRKFSSGFDYIRKKKKIIRKEAIPNKIRRPAMKPSPESVHDIHKEIKGWFINKSIGESHLHRAARLGYVDCVAYCLEKMEADASARDNAGYTPLHFAASKGHVKIGRLLLLYGANVSAAAQGGVRPLHEACENNHVEMIRLLLSYGADPLLVTYAGQTPEELAEGQAARLLRLHIADVQGLVTEPWRFPPLGDIIDREELGCDPLSSPPPSSPLPPPDSMIEIQCTEAPLPPFYSLRPAPGQPSDGLWCLLQDVTNLLQIKSKDSLLKQIHCGSGSPKELLREIRTQEFLERAQCHQLLGAGEKVNVRASKVALVRVTDKLRQLLKIETVLVS